MQLVQTYAPYLIALIIFLIVIVWLSREYTSASRQLDLLKKPISKSPLELELIELLKRQAETDENSREQALLRIQEIEGLHEKHNAALAKIIAGNHPQLPDAITLSRRRKIATVIIALWISLFFIASHYQKPLVAVVFLGIGILAFFVAYHWHQSKLPIVRHRQATIEFEKDPKSYYSAIFASCLIGAMFIYLAYASL